MSDNRPAPATEGTPALPEALEGLIDPVARQVHEAWVGQREGEGWRFGESHDAEAKRHPSLVPYDALPEGEKDIDRGSVRAAVRGLLDLGFRIEPPGEGGIGDGGERPDVGKAEDLIGRIRGAARAEELRGLWEGRDDRLWALEPRVFEVLAETLTWKGLPFWAYDVVKEGLKFDPESVRLRQLQGLILAQTGAAAAGGEVLEGLLEEGHDDVETLGLLGRTVKDQWAREPAGKRKRELLERSYGYYREAFDKHGDVYTGINAATLGVLRGDHEGSRRTVVEVVAKCQEVVEAGNADYWTYATLGEASLLQGDLKKAEGWYRKSVALADGNHSSQSSMRRQARRVLSGSGRGCGELDGVFRVPRVAVFTGHRLDEPGRVEPRFTEEHAAGVAVRLAQVLEAKQIGVGYAAAATGADILFHEAIHARGGTSHVVLPVPVESFRELSVRGAGEASWERRFERVIERAASVTCVSQEDYTGDRQVLVYGNQIMLGLARLEAGALDTELEAIAVWDGEDSGGAGGTADCVAHWAGWGCRCEILSPGAGVVVCGGVRPPVAPASGGGRALGTERQVKAILFADVAGYSMLDECQVPIFVNEFLGRVGELCGGELGRGLLARATWGDAFYFVFDEVRQAGHLALALRDLVAGTDWVGLGFASGFRIRIALHAGPLYPCTDPVTGIRTYTGQHASRAARIEPIVEEGQIYSSEPFAALAAAENVEEFEFEYVGERPLAKRYGTDRLYLLRGAEGRRCE